jgi:hypothetical protein
LLPAIPVVMEADVHVLALLQQGHQTGYIAESTCALCKVQCLYFRSFTRMEAIAGNTCVEEAARGILGK